MAARFTAERIEASARALAAIAAEGFHLNDKAAAGAGITGATAEYARRNNLAKSTVTVMCSRIRQAGFWHIVEAAAASHKAKARHRLVLRTINAEGSRKRVVLMTAAQDETPLHAAFWTNLQAYAAHRNADIMVGGFTYQKGLFEDHSVRTGVYTDELMPHLHPVETQLAPGLWWMGQANILPTTSRPLAGWQTRHGAASIVLPHARIALESVPRMPGAPPKYAMTTGVATLPNYVKRNAGMRAEWRHTIGFAIAEIAGDGSHYLRNVSANSDGSFRDLDLLVDAGVVSAGHSVEAITWGDIHVEGLDAAQAGLCWGLDGANGWRKATRRSMLDDLKPRFQFFHDLIDFSARNHHNRSDPVFMAGRHAARTDSVDAELARAASFLASTARPGCRNVVVDSNHNDALNKWLRHADGRTDPANSAIWHEMNAAWHNAAQRGESRFSPFAHALRARGAGEFTFVHGGESFVICETAPVECGLHGHAGPNGARGSAAAFARMADRVNAGHTHSPAVIEGAFIAGTNGPLKPAFVTGPTSWAPADIITHVTGKRQIVLKTEKGWRG